MKSLIIISIIFLLLTINCKNSEDASAGKLNKGNIEMLAQANLQLIRTIEFYEGQMSFSDTLIRRKVYRFNSQKMIEQYEDFGFLFDSNDSTLTSKELGKKLEEEIASLLKYVNDNIEVERPKWGILYSNLESSIEANQISFVTKNIEDEKEEKNQLKVKRELTFNMVFQLLLRHKFEQEFFKDIRVPIVATDSLLENGLRKVEMYAATETINDVESLEIHFGDEIKNVPNCLGDCFSKEPGPTIFYYNPANVGDSITVKARSKNLLNGVMMELRKEYKTIK